VKLPLRIARVFLLSSKAAERRSAIGFVTYLNYVERLKPTAPHLGRACASCRRHSGFADEAPLLGISSTRHLHDDFPPRPPSRAAHCVGTLAISTREHQAQSARHQGVLTPARSCVGIYSPTELRLWIRTEPRRTRRGCNIDDPEAPPNDSGGRFIEVSGGAALRATRPAHRPFVTRL
jgi:hypothetical protein